MHTKVGIGTRARGWPACGPSRFPPLPVGRAAGHPGVSSFRCFCRD